MNKTSYSEDGQERHIIETEDWNELLLKYLDSGKHVFMYNKEELINVKSIIDEIVVPMLFYTLVEMNVLIEEELKNDVIAVELRNALKKQAELDNYGYLTLTFEQAGFIEKYKKEVKSWLPITIKRHALPNSKKIKDLLSGNI